MADGDAPVLAESPRHLAGPRQKAINPNRTANDRAWTLTAFHGGSPYRHYQCLALAWQQVSTGKLTQPLADYAARFERNRPGHPGRAAFMAVLLNFLGEMSLDTALPVPRLFLVRLFFCRSEGLEASFAACAPGFHTTFYARCVEWTIRRTVGRLSLEGVWMLTLR